MTAAIRKPRATARPKTAPLVAVERQNDAVYAEIRDMIVSGRLAPGARLVEAELAAHFGVSRTPLREVLRRLEQEGNVTRTPTARQTRLVVSPMTREDARELFHVVAALDGLGARDAAGLSSKARATLFRKLRDINTALGTASKARRPDHHTLVALDESFHRTYVHAAAGPRLRLLYDAVKPQAERYERLYVSFLTNELSTSVTEHDRIVRAIRDGNASEAQRAAQANWQNAAERLAGVIARSGERGAWG